MNHECDVLASDELDRVVKIQQRVHAHVYPDEIFPLETKDTKTGYLLPTSEEGLRVLEERVSKQGLFRQEFIASFIQEFPQHIYHLMALEIADKLARIVDDMFVFQMKHYEGKLPRSPYNDAPALVTELQRRVYEITKAYPLYFEACPEAEEFIKVFSVLLVYAKTQRNIEKEAKRLEQLSLQMFRRGFPVFLSFPSEEYTFSECTTKTPRVVEMELRLLFPSKEGESQEFIELLLEQNKEVNDFLAKMPVEYIQHTDDDFEVVCGVALQGFCSGNQTWEVTSAEAFGYFYAMYLSPDMAHTMHLIKHSFTFAGLTAEDGDYRNHVNLIYAAHEASHPKVKNNDKKVFQELFADVPMIIANFKLFLRGPLERPEFFTHITWEKYIASLVGETCYIASNDLEESNTNNGYILSARLIMYLLIKHHIISVAGDNKSYSIASFDSARDDVFSLIDEISDFFLFTLTNDKECVDVFENMEHVYSDEDVSFRKLAKMFDDAVLKSD